ncbi:MAG TPA: glycosyl transferase [Ruminococcaceae bacterium]|nr:glycosyl transferase [Oscillospiraceae bacterium]
MEEWSMNYLYEDVKISVLMGIYNCADTLAESIESVLNQTHANIEFIMCDDGSSDNTYEVAKSYADKDDRIVLLKNEKNITLGPTLNRCLSVATGKYCARMDGDDVSTPDRFEKQVRFLEEHPQYAVVGTFMQIYGTDTVRTVSEFPEIERLAFGNPCCHATILMHTEVYRALGGYSDDLKLARIEDVDLFWRLYLAGYKAANILEPLYIVREDAFTYKRRKAKFNLRLSSYLLNRCKQAKLSKKYYIICLKPILSAVIPKRLMILYHLKADTKMQQKG